MEERININSLPVSALKINNKTAEIQANDWFIKEFNLSINSIHDLKKHLKQGNYPTTFPQTQVTNYDCIINGDNIEINVTFTYKPISEDELIAIVHPYKLNLPQAFNFQDFDLIFGNISYGVIIEDLTNNKTIFVSPFICNSTGYTVDEIKEKTWETLTYKDDISKQETLLKYSDKEISYPTHIEKRIVSKTGKIYWFSEYAKKFELDGIIYKSITLRDITKEKEMEIELLRAKRMTEEAEQLKSAFLDNMPHEIRTPLHAITGFTSLLSDPNLTHEERLEYVNFIQDSSNDILNLMDNIIEIAKLETNQVIIRKEKCYINNILDKLYNNINQKQELLDKKNISIKITKASNDSLFHIISDPERIYQIMTHLLNNALKFTEKGEIEFGYSAPSNNMIEFFVRDTGIGIAENETEHIFKKFGKSGNINTDKNRGSGLGLTLSKKIVELLNGNIALETKQGYGSTFRFTVSIEKEQKITITRPSVTGGTNWSTKTILVAEDTESNYFFIEAFLERTKVNLLWAQDGNEAVEMFKNNDINLILMDIMMPGKDGFDASREIKGINPDIPIIAQTALALPDDEEKCYNAGCDYVLIKPINSDDLIATIKRFIL